MPRALFMVNLLTSVFSINRIQKGIKLIFLNEFLLDSDALWVDSRI